MRVYVEFLGYAAEKVGRRWMWLEAETGCTLGDLFAKHLGSTIGAELANALTEAFTRRELAVAVNGRLVDRLEHVLEDGDRLLVFPIAAGGA